MPLKVLKVFGCLMLTFLLTNSCKKSNNLKPSGVNLNGVYKPSEIYNLSDVQMYTANGQVSDPTTIKNYLLIHQFTKSIIYGVATLPNTDNDFELNFVKNDTAKWSYANNGQNVTTVYRIKDMNASGFILQSVDSAKAIKPNDSGVALLMDNANSIDVYSNCIRLGDVDGYTGSWCTYKQSYPFTIKNEQVYLSSFACGISSYDQYGYSSELDYITGTFNTGIIKNLVKGDTLVFQARMLQLIIKQ